MERAVFLDRDGVINERVAESSYITRWEEFKFLPGVLEAIRRLNEADFLIVIVTNQRGIARKLMTEADLVAIHARMKEALAEAGARVDAIYVCFHEVGEGCGCRKPEPGMLLKAVAEHGIDLSRSWLIGDTGTDIEAGKRAGCRTILITGDRSSCCSGEAKPDLTVATLVEAVDKVLEKDR